MSESGVIGASTSPPESIDTKTEGLRDIELELELLLLLLL